jgi:hypothetical protein
MAHFQTEKCVPDASVQFTVCCFKLIFYRPICKSRAIQSTFFNSECFEVVAVLLCFSIFILLLIIILLLLPMFQRLSVSVHRFNLV